MSISFILSTRLPNFGHPSPENHKEEGLHDWFFWNEQIQRFRATHLKPL
jgi:S-formylglutathione hydrolase FrmB